jgi:hypothetical protein
MQKWEYLEVISAVEGKYPAAYRIVGTVNGKDVKDEKSPFFEYINKCGEDGWELVSNNSGVYTFKRPRSGSG